jgi:TetR/AcrR family transcriptional regulator, regulator of cefoperazone and chloramphenicol sensitivity
VNLPAIQYYFGSKEGLYRAVIADIIQHNEAHMAPATAKVKALLANDDTTPEELLDALCEILEEFVNLVSGGAQAESRRLLYARAEIERTAGLEQLHESGMREMFEPCLKLIGRLIGKSTADPATVIRALALFGQVTIFCNHAVRRVLQIDTLSEERVSAIQAIVRSQTRAIMRDALATAAKSPHPKTGRKK